VGENHYEILKTGGFKTAGISLYFIPAEKYAFEEGSEESFFAFLIFQWSNPAHEEQEYTIVYLSLL
jgi:hypothetical protein